MWRLKPFNPALRRKRQAGFWVWGQARQGREKRTNCELPKSSTLCCSFQVGLQVNVNEICTNHCTAAPTSEMCLKDTNRLKAKDRKQCALLSLVKRKPKSCTDIDQSRPQSQEHHQEQSCCDTSESPENTLLNVYLLVTDPRIYWEMTEYKENLDKHGIGDKPVIPALRGNIRQKH